MLRPIIDKQRLTIMIFNWFWGKLPILAVPGFSRGKGRLHRDQPDSEESGWRRRKVFPISAYWQRRPTHGRARSINLRECATDVSQPQTQCLGRIRRKGKGKGEDLISSNHLHIVRNLSVTLERYLFVGMAGICHSGNQSTTKFPIPTVFRANQRGARTRTWAEFAKPHQ